MAYEENGFIPQLKDPWSTGLHNDYWEYMWSLVARAVVWAADRVPESSVENVTVKNNSLFISCKNAMKGDILSGEITDDFGVVEKSYAPRSWMVDGSHVPKNALRITVT